MNQTKCRRSGPRSLIHLPVTIRTHSHEPEQPAHVNNLSAHGISLRTDESLEADHEIEVTFFVPYEMTLTKFIPVRMKGRVVSHGESMDAQEVAAMLMPIEPASEAPVAWQAAGRA